MNLRIMLTATLLLFVATTTVNADQLLWDNYPGGIETLQNPSYNMSSERNTAVWESTWVVDDVDLAQIPGFDPGDGFGLTRLEWVGARDANFTYSSVDVIILDSNLNTIQELSGLIDFTTADVSAGVVSGLQMYEGSVSLTQGDATPLQDLPEHFYIGVRLVGDGYYQGCNRSVTSSIDSTLRGRTEGYTRASIFGAPDWEPASSTWYAPPTEMENMEFAFRVYSNVPEPAGLLMLLAGGFLGMRRR